MDHIPRGLLTRAWLRFLQGNATGSREHLNEAEAIAQRGPMPLYLADVHLTRARLFLDPAELARARRLLEQLRTKGYHRRDREPADAEAVLGTDETEPHTSTP